MYSAVFWYVGFPSNPRERMSTDAYASGTSSPDCATLNQMMPMPVRLASYSHTTHALSILAGRTHDTEKQRLPDDAGHVYRPRDCVGSGNQSVQHLRHVCGRHGSPLPIHWGFVLPSGGVRGAVQDEGLQVKRIRGKKLCARGEGEWRLLSEQNPQSSLK